MTNKEFYILKLNTNGTTEFITTKKCPDLQQLYDLIGCDCVETVRITHDVLMLVDESGRLKDNPVPNFKASLLYSNTPHSIAGNAVLLKLNRRACDWEAFTFDEAVAVHIEIEARAEAYIQGDLMHI